MKSKKLAITSFAFSLTFWIPLINLVFGILAIFLGIKALKNIKKAPDKYGGKAFAISGIILGTLPIFLYILSLGLCLGGYKEVCESINLTFLSWFSDKICS